MRYIIFGAGGVGGTIGARMFQNGHDVILIARGKHFEKLHENGLIFQAPDGTHTLPLPVVESPEKIEFTLGDVVMLTMKSQDSFSALEVLKEFADRRTPVVSVQNGVENERLALRRFENVYGICVLLPAAHMEPGTVQLHAAPLSGILDIGRYPRGIDAVAEQIATDLESSTFGSIPDSEIMRQKYAKLLMNLGNALDAACGREARGGELYRQAIHEALACFEAAGIDAASRDEVRERRGDSVQIVSDESGRSRAGGSTWQSLARMAGTVETEYLNGEIVLMGRLHGIPTPVNQLLVEVIEKMALERMEPGSMSLNDLVRRLD